VEKAHDEFAAATADLKKQIFAKESALNAELYGEKTDDKKVDALVAEINALNGKIYAEKVKMHRVMAKEGILPEMGHGKMGGGCPMMGRRHETRHEGQDGPGRCRRGRCFGPGPCRRWARRPLDLPRRDPAHRNPRQFPQVDSRLGGIHF
jgi:hypothetical protein